MPPPNRQHFPTSQADLEWVITDDGSRTLHDKTLDETFHSGCGAASESLVVYVENSGVGARLRSGQNTRVMEIGFGTGTAFFLTAALAAHFDTALHFVGVELRPIHPQVLDALAPELISGTAKCLANEPRYDQWSCGGEVFSTLPTLIGDFLQQYRSFADARSATRAVGGAEVVNSEFCWRFGSQNQCSLSLLIADATAKETWNAAANIKNPSMDASATPLFDAIYFDPFSPDTAPQLWSDEVFGFAASVLRPGGTLSSYCVKGDVRRRLAQADFAVTRLPGPQLGKREVLLCRRN